MLTPTTKARLRLTLIALGLVPLALLARATYNGELMKFVIRHSLKAWDAYDKTRDR